MLEPQHAYWVIVGLLDGAMACLTHIVWGHRSTLKSLSSRYAWLEQEVSMLRQEVAQLRKTSDLDPLTGVRSQRLLDAELPTLLRSGQPLALVYIDLDGLKEVNTTHGHQVGDQFIRSGAQAICHALRRDSDRAQVYRRGNAADEFLVLLRGARQNVAIHLAGQILAGLNHVGIHASIGVASSSERMSAADLERAAELAMEWAKTDGRNCVRSHSRPDSQETPNPVGSENTQANRRTP